MLDTTVCWLGYDMRDSTTTLACACGRVTLDVQAEPIVSGECLCADCQQAGAFLETLPGAPSILNQNRATRLVLYRKDRVRCTKGAAELREHRLLPDSKTRRVVAACCNTPMFLEFTQGHWLSIYGNRWPDSRLPPLEMRSMTRDKPEDTALPDDVPNSRTHSFRFYARLMAAWAAMRFHSPRITYVAGVLDVDPAATQVRD